MILSLRFPPQVVLLSTDSASKPNLWEILVVHMIGRRSLVEFRILGDPFQVKAEHEQSVISWDRKVMIFATLLLNATKHLCGHFAVLFV